MKYFYIFAQMTKIHTFTQFNENTKNLGLWDIIPQSIKSIHSLFTKNGYKLFLVGGSVRDYLQGDEPKDYDLATNAMPETVMEILKGFTLNLQGKAFGVVVVFTDDQPLGMEIATFRKDITKGRNPVVSLDNVTIEDDVKRRDLTYNALFYDLDKKEIIDLVGGINDLENKLTKMVGDPLERIDEDPLRIQRAFRFAAYYNSELDPLLVDALNKRNWLSATNPNSGKLERISQERIWEEITKSWKKASYNFVKYLNFYTQFKMWQEVFPGFNINSLIVKCNFFETYMANLFKGIDVSSTQRAESQLVSKYRMDGNNAAVVVFLNSLLQLKPATALKLYKSKYRISSMGYTNIDDIIKDWFYINAIADRMLLKFIDYKPSTDIDDLMSKGLKDKALGDEVQRLELIAFNELN